MSSIKKRLERLERFRKGLAPIIVLEPGDNAEEVWEKHLAENPEHAKAKPMFIRKSYHDQDPEP